MPSLPLGASTFLHSTRLALAVSSGYIAWATLLTRWHPHDMWEIRMRPFMIFCASASLAAAQVRVPVEFDGGPSWAPQPTFLSNPADRPVISASDGCVTLRVAEPGKGMKFELSLRPFDSASATYMFVRYKASELGGGYALWVYDGSSGGRMILSTSELKQDGQWHVAAIDLEASGVVGSVRSVLTEVQWRGKPASITFDYLRVGDEIPEGADVHPKQRPVDVQHIIRPAELDLQAQPTWLSKTAPVFGAETEGGLLHLHATGHERGMKWSADLLEPVDLSKYSFVTVRYRARGVEGWGDYLLWLGSGPTGKPPEYASPISLRSVRATDSWEVVVATVPETFKAVCLALQVSSSGEKGEIWIDHIRFTGRRPLIDVADVIPVAVGWTQSRLPAGSFAAVDLARSANARAQGRLRSLGLSKWFPAGRNTVRQIPFAIPGDGKNVVSTLPDIDQTASISVGAPGTEIYLLMVAKLPYMPRRHGRKPRLMTTFSNPERLVFQVEYGDGLVDEVLPVCVGTRKHEVRAGPEVYCLTGLRRQPVKCIALRTRMEAGTFLVAGVTLNQGEPATQEPHVIGLPEPCSALPEHPGAGQITAIASGFTIGNDLIQLDLKTADGIAVRSIENRCLLGGELHMAPGPIFEIGAGDVLLTSEQVAVGKPRTTGGDDKQTLSVPVDGSAKGVPIKGELVITVGQGADILMRLNLEHVGDAVITPVVNFPLLSNMRIDTVEDTWYLWCRKGGVINNVPTHQRQAYGGEYPLQVADIFNPSAGGLALLTYDLDNVYRFWDLAKDRDGVDWRIEYWQREHQPGERIETVPAALRAHTGDWRRALAIYKQWTQSWHRPQVPRKDWFRRVFYYQQTTAWGSLRNRATGKWRMAELVKTYRDYFGRLDYLHIFDFGQSKVYGRVGDYNHYDELGGLATMRTAIKQAQDLGVPIGLYIEGYLCDERGVWGRENVLKFDIRKKDGKSLLWPGTPTEHMMCAAARGWRDHLASTYKRVAEELRPNGMYIDQYGFINTWKACWSREHSHPVPWPPIRGESDTTQAIRAEVPPGIATLTEETPNDVTSQYQDGGLGYSVWQADPNLMPHRVDLFRFVFPSFKVFQLTQYHTFTDGEWERLKFPFFNGEGYWLGGGTDRTYSEDAHQFLRKAFAILHEYEDAFCSDDVEPLVPTLCPTVYANRFIGKGRTVWTLFNAQFRTFRGDCLRVPHQRGARYTDAFSREGIEPRIKRGKAIVPVEIGPRGVGCIVASPVRPDGLIKEILEE